MKALLSAEELQAHLTSLQKNTFGLRRQPVFTGSRTRPICTLPYRPVLKLIRADRPRILIADEVGVGKTIEAGLIIKELRARMDISSVLVICPRRLSRSANGTEMKRFDESFTALDALCCVIA